MSPAEQLRIVAFLAVVVATYVLAVGVIARRFVRWIRKSEQPARRRMWAERAILGMAAVGVACMAYGAWVEPYWPAVTHVRIGTRKLPARARPIRIVHISDLH